MGTLIISIDGYSQNVYEKYRIGGKVEKVLENIKLLNKINNYYSNPVTILPQYIVFDHNYDEVEDFKKFCENLNLRFIFKKPYIRYGDKVKSRMTQNIKEKIFKRKRTSRCNIKMSTRA